MRRPSGDLRAAVLRVLGDAGRPVSALALRQGVSRQGLAVAPSLVFRELRKLVDRGAVRKIWAARGYMLNHDAQTVILFCRCCGDVADIRTDETFSLLNQAAADRGFAISRTIVEVPGLCRACAARDRP